LEDLLYQLERELMIGKGRWTAEFYESERDFQLEDLTFDVLLKGDTKIRGYGLFSRIMSFMLLPKYAVYCYVMVKDSISSDFLKKCVNLIKKKAKVEDVQWNFLLLITKQDAPKKVIEYIKCFEEKDLGLLLYNPHSKFLVNSKNKLGERIRTCISFERKNRSN